MRSSKEQVQKQVVQVKQRVDQLIKEISVGFEPKKNFVLFSDAHFLVRFQGSSMSSGQIDVAYKDLVSSIDREFRRLKQVLAEQEIKEEEERLRKIQVGRTKKTFETFFQSKNSKEFSGFTSRKD